MNTTWKPYSSKNTDTFQQKFKYYLSKNKDEARISSINYLLKNNPVWILRQNNGTKIF